MSAQVQILSNGFQFVVGHPYSRPDARAATFTVVIASLELICTSALLTAILMFALNARGSDNPHLFVRTHSATLFISLVFCTVLQAIGGVMTSAWVHRSGVYIGTVCSIQAVIKHISDVGIAVWTLVIAGNSFYTLWRPNGVTLAEQTEVKALGFSVPRNVFYKWATSILVWFVIAVIVVIGPEIASSRKNGDFYGVSGGWCWITDGYIPERIVFAYLIMITSAVVSIALYVWAFHHNRRLRKEKPASEYIISNEDQADEYAIRLSRYMIWYPLAYFCCIIPIAIHRFVYWSGVRIPFGATTFVDAIYHLFGIINCILFFCSPRLLPQLTFFPSLFTSAAYANSRAESYAHPQYKQEKQFMRDRRPPPLHINAPAAPKLARIIMDDPFATPVQEESSMRTKLDILKDKVKVNARGRHERPGSSISSHADSSRQSLGFLGLPVGSMSPSRASISTISTTTSMDKDLPSLPKKRVIGLPPRPLSRRSSSTRTESLSNPFADQAPRQSHASRASHRLGGLPMHPAAPLHPQTPNENEIIGIERSHWSATTATESTANASTATATIGLPTALRSVATANRGRRFAYPSSAVSSASPLTGARFEMVTQGGVYVAGMDGIAEEDHRT